MEVLAVSAALPTWQDVNGNKTWTSIVREPLKSGVLDILENGIKDNDTAVHDGPVYVFFQHHYDYWCRELGVPRASWKWCRWGENITLKFDDDEVLDESQIHVGDVWEIGSARLRVSGARIPCFKLAWRCGQKDKWLASLARSGFCGVYLDVLKTGKIRVGDRGRIVERMRGGFDCASITQTAFSQGSLKTRDTMNLLANDKALLGMLRAIFHRKVAMFDDKAREERNAWSGWRQFRPFKIVDEGANIISFYIKPVDGEPLASFRPGQFLTIRLPNGAVRSWSLSDWPQDPDVPDYYRVSIKKSKDASVWMATKCTTGTTLDVRSPKGKFVLDWDQLIVPRQIYVSAGIGITPILSMMKAQAAHPTMHSVPAIWIHVLRNRTEVVFQQEMDILPSNLKKVLFFTAPCKGEDEQGRDYDVQGRPDKKTVSDLICPKYMLQITPNKKLELDGQMSAVYICGPAAFEESMRSSLGSLGIPPPLIHSELFTGSQVDEMPDLEEAVVRFTKSKIEAVWNKKRPSSILELAEEAGLTPDYGCRSGTCGSCAAKLVCGKTAGGLQADGSVYICSARPDTELVEIEI